MSTAAGEQVTRDDGEVVGEVRPGPDGWTPCTVFGAPLSAPTTRPAAEAHLRAEGLAVLAGPWALRLDDGDHVAVQLVEASPAEVVVEYVDLARDDLHGRRRHLPAPTGDALHPRT